GGRGLSGDGGGGPWRMRGRGGGGGRLRRLHGGDGRLCRAREAPPRRADDRMLDERQRRGTAPRDRLHTAVQSLPAHEANHAAQDPPCARDHATPGHHRSRSRREGATFRRRHARGVTMDNIGSRYAGRPVIVGGGLAGLLTALSLAPQPVLLLAKTPLGEGVASAWAQGGVAAALGNDDSAELHAA